MAKTGRPTKYKQEYCDQLIKFMHNGKSLMQFAKSIGICRQTIDEWGSQHHEFLDAIKQGNAAAEAWWEEKVQAMVEVPSALIFYMKARFGWRDKEQTIVNKFSLDDTRAEIADRLRLAVMRKNG